MKKGFVKKTSMCGAFYFKEEDLLVWDFLVFKMRKTLLGGFDLKLDNPGCGCDCEMDQLGTRIQVLQTLES